MSRAVSTLLSTSTAQRGAMTTTHDKRRDGTAASADRLVVTVAEAAGLLGISPAFAYELVARGELPVIRLGRQRLVARRALLELVGEAVDAKAEGSGPSGNGAALVYRLVAEPDLSA